RSCRPSTSPTARRCRSRCCSWCCSCGRRACSVAPRCRRSRPPVATFLATYDFLLVSMVLAAVLALTLYLPLMAGQLSVASPGFYALGGYVAAILSTKVFHPAPGLYPVSLVLIEMAVAAVVSGILGIAVGLPALRLRGIFLALATIAFVQILGVVALNLDVTGGAIGIFGIPQPFGSQLQYMWLAIPLLLLSMLFVARLDLTRTGRA